MCHSISVKSTMGQGDYTIEYPPMYRLATSENPLVRTLHDFVVKVSPEPHRRTFMKPFVREQTAELCSACHKVHLDSPVNNYRWIRGFNDYDNWQAQRRVRGGGAFFLLPGRASNMHRLPYAADFFARRRQSGRTGALPPLPCGQHGVAGGEPGPGSTRCHRRVLDE